MTLTLTPEQEAVLDKAVSSGRFPSREQAVGAKIAALAEELAEEEYVDELHRKYPTLVDLFADSPFREYDIEITRDTSTLRDIEF